MKFLRNVAILLAGALTMFYVAALLLLFIYQRDLLFPRDKAAIDAPPQSSVYRVRQIVEADGTRLAIWEAPPARRRVGTFVTFHGNGSSLLEFAPVGEEIHREGFGVVLASYRGYSGNTGQPSEAGLMADARAVLATIPKADGPIICGAIASAPESPRGWQAKDVRRRLYWNPHIPQSSILRRPNIPSFPCGG